MEKEQLKPVLEAVLMASSQPLSVEALIKLFPDDAQPEKADVTAALEEMVNECEGRSYELKEVRSGYRFQVRKDYADYVTRLWEEKPARYSRALLETIALIAYKQPITRGEIEAVRGVSVSTQIIKTLDERGWIKIVGHRDVPGRPSLYATTKEFLDYFNLKSLDELPSLQEIRDIDKINAELDLRLPETEDKAKGEEGAAAVINLESDVGGEDSDVDQNDLQSAEDQPKAEEGDVAVISLESEMSDESGEENNNPPSFEAAPASVEN